MFNFNLMNKALLDTNLSDKEFRLLYLIVNNMSMNNTNEIEMYNGFLMDKLNICERQVRRLTSSLVEKGYITKVNTGTKNNRNANVYRLCDTVVDISGDKNVPPNNTRKINKNISVYTGEDKNVRGEDAMNISVQVEDNTNAAGNEYEDGTCGDDVNTSIDISSTASASEGTKMYNDASTDVKDDGTTPQVKLSKDEIRRRNDYISTVYKRLDTKLDFLYSLRTYSLYVDEVNTIAKIITEAQGHSDWFTSKQWNKLTWYCERFVKITEVKDNYFNGCTKKNADADTISVDDENAGTNYNDSTNDNPVPAPTDWAKVGAWVVDSLQKFPTYEAWEKELDRILNKKFGDGWECAEHQIMSQAAAIYNRCTKTAIDHYRSLENSTSSTPTPTEEQTNLAPWEMKKQDTYAEIDPTLDGYLTPSVEDTTQTAQVAHESVSEVEPTNPPTESYEALRCNLYASDEVEPDDEDMDFGEYVEKACAKVA